MILVDANLLLYAYDASASQHDKAKHWWEQQLSNPAPVRLAWVTVLAFIRIGTNPRIFTEPLSIEEACAAVSAWLQCPMLAILEPGEHHWTLLRELLQQAQACGNLVMDAHLAALAIENGAVLCSTDCDFSRFQGLTWENPLA